MAAHPVEAYQEYDKNIGLKLKLILRIVLVINIFLVLGIA